MPRAVLSQITASYARLGSKDALAVPLVLVHGLAASSAFWLRALDRLGTGSSRVAFRSARARPQFRSANGFTSFRMGQDLIELLDFLSLERVVLVGHSFGGTVATYVAHRCPSRVDGLVLADTRLRVFQPDLTLAAWPQWRDRGTRLRELGFSFDENEPEAGIRLLTEMARAEINCKNGENLPRWIHEFFGQRQSRFTAARWLELVEQTTLLEDIKQEEWLSVEVLRKLDVPLLGIYGENSPVAPSGRLLKEACPRTKLRIVAGAGHFFPATRPVEFVEASARFPARTTSDQPRSRSFPMRTATLDPSAALFFSPEPQPGLREKDFRKICANGFGDGYNAYAYSMAWFDDHVYVGTSRANLHLLKLAMPFVHMDVWPVEVREANYTPAFERSRRAWGNLALPSADGYLDTGSPVAAHRR